MSEDHGETWLEVGPVDGSDTHVVMFARNLIMQDNTIYSGAWSRHENALYASLDGLSWEKRSVVFPTDYPEFDKLADAGPPFYPHVLFCPDGTLLAMTYHTPPHACCYSRRSCDGGATWEPIVRESTLNAWAPRMKRFDAETLILTGRNTEIKSTVAWVYTSSPQSEGRGDIVGVLLGGCLQNMPNVDPTLGCNLLTRRDIGGGVLLCCSSGPTPISPTPGQHRELRSVSHRAYDMHQVSAATVADA